MTSCKKTNCLIAFLGVFAFMFVFDKLFHGCPWMMDQYNQTAALWRSEDAMKEVFPWFFARYALLAMLFTCLYKRWSQGACCCPGMSGSCGMKAGETKKPCPMKCAVCFGVKIGLIMGTIMASSYIWMPIPAELAISWFAGSVLQGVGIGIILGIVLKKKEGACNA